MDGVVKLAQTLNTALHKRPVSDAAPDLQLASRRRRILRISGDDSQIRNAVTIEQIQRRVAEHFDVRLADMTSKRRPANIAFPRQIAMYLARELTKASLNESGDAFGGRDHGTVLHACKLVKRRMQEQDNIRQTISFIDSALQR